MNTATLTAWAPRMLSVLRIIAGALLLQHGVMKLIGYPISMPTPPAFLTLLWFSGVIELVGGALLVLGLFTRQAAFICCGFAAVAYFMQHSPRGFWPIQNGGELITLYCFVFMYLIFAGPGPWSLDAKRSA